MILPIRGPGYGPQAGRAAPWSRRGIGRGHALALAANGAKVVVNDIDEDEAQKVVDEVKSASGTAVGSGASVDSREGCKSLVDLCVSEFGRIDAMVNNAGNVRDRAGYACMLPLLVRRCVLYP